jgi:hypothetical protein
MHHQTICLTYGFGLGQWVVTQAATAQSPLAANVCININKEYSNTKALMKQKLQQQSLLQHQTTTISSIVTATSTAMLVYVWIKCVNGF